MRFLGSFFLFSTMMFVACSNDGNPTIPEIPDDPEGTKVTILSRGGSEAFLDDTDNGVKLDENGCLQGDDLFFTSSQKYDGLSYITSIPISDWHNKSNVLKKGDGLVMSSRISDGITFTTLFVEDVNNTTGSVTLKNISPFYGNTKSFYLNSIELNKLYKEAGSAKVVLTAPTTYNVELTSGEWASVKPYTTYVLVSFSENLTGTERRDTLVFSNGAFPIKRLPIVQLGYSLNDSNQDTSK